MPLDRDSKSVDVGDLVTLEGRVTAISGDCLVVVSLIEANAYWLQSKQVRKIKESTPGHRRIDFITLHTAAASRKDANGNRVALHQKGKEIDHFHRTKDKPFKKIGYQVFVEEDGTISEFGRAESEIPAAVEGFNDHILALCVSGHGDLEDWNGAQRLTVMTKLTEWCIKYGLDASRVIGHHEADEHGAPTVFKTCPGTKIDLPGLRKKLVDALSGSNL